MDRSSRSARAWRGAVAAMIGGAVLLGGAAVVRADDVSNDLDLTIDAAAEAMSLTAGGADRSTTLRIVEANGDGKNGCNLTGSTTLTAAVSSSDTAVARVSPASVTFTSCGAMPTLTVTPVGPGSSTVSLTQATNTTGATFDLAPATFTVSVAPPAPPANTSPAVAVTGVAAVDYDVSSVPAAGCSVVDAEDGSSTFPADLSPITGPLSGSGLGHRTATCSYTDRGGARVSASVTYQIVDRGQPDIALLSRLPVANEHGWNNGDVTVTWSCDDAVSGVAAATVSATRSAEGAGQSAGGTCTDGSGNSSSATVGDINIDKTPPTIELQSVTPEGPGWQSAPVVVTWSCADAGGSGVVAPTVTALVDGDGPGQTATGTCADRAGNTSAPATVGDIAVDRTAPSITRVSRTPADANGWNRGDVTVVWACADLTSGVTADTVTATLTEEGADQPLTGTCTDGAGNTASATEAHINVDKTAPAATLTSRTPDANAAGWNAAAVTVTWSCADAGSGPATSTVSATVDTEGVDQVAAANCADLAGNTAEASVAGINIDTTAPTITFDARTAPNEAGWNDADVAVRWSCDDARSGPTAATVTETVTTEGRDQTVTGTCTDRAGNTAADTRGDVNIDRTGPGVELASRTPANQAGWNDAAVAVEWTCTDTLSGPDRDTVSATVSTEGADQTARAECADIAGNTTPATLGGINIDTTSPQLTFERTAANAAGWNRPEVTVDWTCTDTGSGVAFVTPTQTLADEGAGQSADGSCVDEAGNTTEHTVDGINIDGTKPSIAWTGGPAVGGSYVFQSVPTEPTCSSVDALSGPDACIVTGYATTVGTHTVTATATDRAGNQATVSRTYTVVPWRLSGFYQPVDMNGVLNTVRSGSTVPLKFEVFAGTRELTDPSIATFTVKGVACPGAAPSDEIEFTTTGGTALRYDAVAGQFVQNWQTPKNQTGCYVVTMTTTDGTSISAHFKLK